LEESHNFHPALVNAIREGREVLVHDPNGEQTSGFKAAKELCNQYGYQLIAFKDLSHRLNAFVNLEQRIIFVDVDGDHPVLNVVGHEMSHAGTHTWMPLAEIEKQARQKSKTNLFGEQEKQTVSEIKKRSLADLEKMQKRGNRILATARKNGGAWVGPAFHVTTPKT
jgi:hypothetical protein